MAGFRKSLLGFNCDDVINYIQAAQAKFSRRENELNDEIKALNDKLADANKNIESLNAQNNKIMSELNAFKAKADEIEQLSVSIGKLYLVSQNSAKNIINNSVESSRLANEQVNKNLDGIEDAHTTLAEIKQKLEVTANDFLNNVDELCASLQNTKREIAERNENSEKEYKEFAELFNKVNNAK